MRYVFIADDFTGASDCLATLRCAGVKARLYLEVPSLEEVADLEAFGIATAARSMNRPALIEEMQRIAQRLVRHKPEIVHLKVCSTFDSSVEVGNIAIAMQALTEILEPATTCIVGGQPSLGRYCIFGNLFAKGSDGSTYRIDRHPVMRRHPVTPMGEADLRRHFEAMGLADVALLDRPSLYASDGLPTTPLLCDVLEESDLARIGERFRPAPLPQLWVGASSVAQAHHPHRQAIDRPRHLPGPLLIFAGSRSAVTATQVAASRHMTKIAMGVKELTAQPRALCDRILSPLGQGEAVLAVLDDDATHGFTPLDVAQHCAQLIASLVGSGRIGTLLIAGGDTSSLALGELRPKSIDYLGPFQPGVPICIANVANLARLPIIMKGGQMGTTHLFDEVLALTHAPPS